MWSGARWGLDRLSGHYSSCDFMAVFAGAELFCGGRAIVFANGINCAMAMRYRIDWTTGFSAWRMEHPG